MLSRSEEILLAIMMLVIMFGMGAGLTFRDFRLALRTPKPVMVGFSSQYVIMPLLAYTLGKLLGLEPEHIIGLVLVGCMPGGTTSNIFAYFSKSLLSLSIVMTICSTLGAAFLVPVLMKIYTGDLEAQYQVPVSKLAGMLFALLVPVILGMVLRRKKPNSGAVSELLGGVLGVVVIIFLMVSWIPRNWRLLIETSLPVYLAVVLIGWLGFTFGYFFARLLGLDKQKARTVSLETGIQNGPLAVLVGTLTFSGLVQQKVLIIPILYSLFIVLSSSIITFYYRKQTLQEELARDAAKIETLNNA